MPRVEIPEIDESFLTSHVFSGPVYQRGHGFFGDMFRKIMPIFREKVLPYLGKQLLNAGGDLVDELKQGKPIKSALKTTLDQTIARGRDDLVRKLSGGGIRKRVIRRKSTPKKVYNRKRKTRLGQSNSGRYRDYFSVT